jgi:hypothetical protein
MLIRFECFLNLGTVNAKCKMRVHNKVLNGLNGLPERTLEQGNEPLGSTEGG